MFIRRFLAGAILVSAASTTADGSRRFDGATDSIAYPIPDPGSNDLFDGTTELSISLWVKAPALASGTGEILNYVDGNGDNGFRLFITSDGSSRDLTLRYDTGVNSPLETSVPLDDFDPEAWLLVAGEILLPEPDYNGQNRVRLLAIQTGSSPAVDSTTSAESFAPIQQYARDLHVGANASGDDRFEGEIHDITIIDDPLLPWLPFLLTRTAFDVLPDIRFIAPLRASLDATTPGGDITGTAVNDDMERGIGPAIRYDDQLPSIIVIGDTQNISTSDMDATGDFIVEYRETLNLQAVFHVGDWVNSTGTLDAVEMARHLADRLRLAGIPWTCTIGNHESIGTGDLSVWSQEDPRGMPHRLFMWEDEQQTVPPDWPVINILMGDTQVPMPFPPGHPSDEPYAHAFVFDLDGAPQVGVTLPFGPTKDMLKWLTDTVLGEPEFAGLPVWLSTHSFLGQDGRLNMPLNPPPDEATPLEILDAVPNLRAVVSGHVWDENPFTGKHRCGYASGSYMDAQGDPLPPTFEFLVNAQQANPPPGGGGFMQIFSISVDGAGQPDTIAVESYVPVWDVFLDVERVNPDLTFSLSFSDPCWTDCQPDGLDDAWQILSGGAEDCNRNDIPDACDLAKGTSKDCNGNGIPDECDIEALDCNRNGVPDDCDLSSGYSEDCNGNGIPDECDIVSSSPDCDFDGVPDECCEPPGCPVCALRVNEVSQGQFPFELPLVEIRGEPGQALDDHKYVVISWVADFRGEGVVEAVIDLDGEVVNPNGHDFVYDPPGFTGSRNRTHLLVNDPDGLVVAGTDLDVFPEDGILDFPAGVTEAGLGGIGLDAGDGHLLYGQSTISLTPTEYVAFRCDVPEICWVRGSQTTPGNRNPDDCACSTPAMSGDVDGDGKVDGADVILILVAWGTPDARREDVNRDTIVDIRDLMLVIERWQRR